jgi:hypothetical protein
LILIPDVFLVEVGIIQVELDVYTKGCRIIYALTSPEPRPGPGRPSTRPVLGQARRGGGLLSSSSCLPRPPRSPSPTLDTARSNTTPGAENASMATPSSSATTPSPPLAPAYLHTILPGPEMDVAALDIVEQHDRQRAVDNFLARAELATVSISGPPLSLFLLSLRSRLGALCTDVNGFTSSATAGIESTRKSFYTRISTRF